MAVVRRHYRRRRNGNCRNRCRNIRDGRFSHRIRLAAGRGCRRKCCRGTLPLLRQIQGRQRQIGHALQCDQVALFKGIRMIGKQFEQPPDLAVLSQQRQHNDGRNAQRPACFQIHPRIALVIVAAQQLPPGNTLSRQSRANLQPRSHCRSGSTSTGAANHLFSLRQSKRRPGSAGNVLRAFHQQLQRGVELCFFQLAAAIGSIANRTQNGGPIRPSGRILGTG